MRGTDARRRKRDRPEGVTQGFQVIVYKVDPRISVFARNLLSKDDWRLALADEVIPGRPEVPLIIKSSSFACRAERLARTGTGPNRSIVGPACAPEGMRPDADTGEEVALCVSANIFWSNIFNAPFIDITGGDVPPPNQISQPLSRVGINFVVVGSHRHHA